MVQPSLLPDGAVWCGSANQLEAILPELESLDEIVLDTEFHAERRFVPELMLLQLGLPGDRVALVDARVLDLRPLAPVLASKPWVVHAASQDVLILHHVLGVLPPVLRDTQLLAGFLGHKYPSGLGTLSEAVLGEPMDKGEALTDWAARPLTASQLHYAAQDVRVARKLWRELVALAPDRVGWAEEEGDRMVDRLRRPKDPGADIARWRVAEKLRPEQLRVLAALYRWRYRLAQERGQPPGYVLSDGVALDLARRLPDSLDKIKANRRTPSGLVKRWGSELLQLVAEARVSDAPVPRVLTRADRAQLQRDQIWAAAVGAQVGVAPSLLLPEDLARELLWGRATLEGWRKELAGEFFSAWRSGLSGVLSGGELRSF